MQIILLIIFSVFAAEIKSDFSEGVMDCPEGYFFNGESCVSTPNCGPNTVLTNGVCQVIDIDKPPFNEGDCLIATASYGSVLAPQVQMLREIRDNTLLNTESGKTFMNAFNTVYYLFSPQVAQLENENPIFKEIVKVFITPMIAALSIMTLADGTEFEVVFFGVSTIGVIVGMYVIAPGMIIYKIKKSRK